MQKMLRTLKVRAGFLTEGLEKVNFARANERPRISDSLQDENSQSVSSTMKDLHTNTGARMPNISSKHSTENCAYCADELVHQDE